MRNSLLAARALVRVGGVAQIILGILLWFHVSVLLQLHMAMGGMFLIGLWIVALIALFVLPHRIVPLLTLLWGGIILWLGMAQTTMMVGEAHWVIRVLHLVVGLIGIGLGERLAAAVYRHRGWNGPARNTDSAAA